jgi:choline dehydrogenase-like flavoprotein
MRAPDGLPTRCEVLVVGSGAGGATTAAVLAEAGLDVVVVEEGEWIEQGEIAPFSLEQMERQYRSGGVTVALGRPGIAYTEGRCVGGGTEINSGLYRRPPVDVLDRWRNQYGIADFAPEGLESIADEVEEELSVSTVPGPVTPSSALLRDGSDALGWRQSEIPRWMEYPDGGSATSGRRRSMTETYLPRARRAGARVVSGCRVRRLREMGRGVVADVDVVGERREVLADHVFVCGGAIQTPALLQRSGLRKKIGASLAIHPTVKLSARFPDEVNVGDDVPVHQVKEFAPNLSFGGSASHPGLLALALSDEWSTFGRAVESWRNMSVYYAAITSEGRGRVDMLPGFQDPVVTYRLTRRDRDLLRSGLNRLALVMLEAGATEVYPSYRGAPVVRGRRDLADLAAGFSANRASVMTVHLCSTVPMGESDRCPADSFGTLKAAERIIVNDASLLPDAPGVNPQAAVMAIAIRNARQFAATRSGSGT